MKKIIIIFLVFFGLQSMYAQNLQLHFENAYDFSRINEAFVVVSQPSKKDLLYKTDSYGRINIAVSGQVKVYFYARDYKSIQANFDVTKDLDVKVILAPNTYQMKPDDSSVFIDGIVMDKNTGKPLANAQVSFIENRLLLQTNAQGKFTLNKQNLHNYMLLKEGIDSLHFEVSKPGYEMQSGIFRFTTATEYKGILLQPIQKRTRKTASPIANNKLIEVIKNSSSSFTESPLTGCGSLPTTIRVGVNCSCNSCPSVAVMSLQNYVEKGLNDEWIASWLMDSLKAGSMAYKSYGAYYVLHPINPNYDISDTTCKQVWDNDVSSNCVTAAQATQGVFIVTASDNIARCEYSAENNGLNAPNGESCGDGYSGTGSSWPCITDNVCAGHDRYGHGRGMCQWGTQRWAQQYQNFEWITDHYYNPGHFYRCNASHPQPDLTAFDITMDVSVVAPGHTVSTTARVQNISNGESDRTRMAFYLSTDATFDANDLLLSYLYINKLDPYQSQNISKTLTIPVTTTDGNYHILFFEDYQNSNSETNENNNVQSMPLTVDSTNAISDSFITKNIQLFPNPTSGIIQINKQNNIEITHIELFNLQGQFIMDYPTNSKSINISDLASGAYIIKITDNNQQTGVFKITKK